ncbi:MAG: hypothetical protein EBZ07_07570, partial [Verrucomicrobia bacterium]|nr:hypothetical protein [Verrucomicrobiota bacterium]
TDGTNGGGLNVSLYGPSTWTLSGTSTIKGRVIMSSGGANGILRNTGNLTAGGNTYDTTFRLQNGTFDNQGQLTLTGPLALDNNASRLMNSGTIGQSGGNRLIFLSEGSSAANSGVINLYGIAVGDWGADGGAANTATFTNNAGGAITVSELNVGKYKYGTFNNSGGNTTVSSLLGIGKADNGRTAAAGTNTFNLNSGTVTVNSGATFRLGAFNTASGATGIFNLDGGTLATAVGLIGPGGTNNTGTFNFNGGTLRGTANNLTLLGTGLTAVNVKSGGGTVEIGTGLVNTISANLLDGGGNGGLTKTGDGTLVLSGTNTYTGTTTVSQGKLQIGDAAGLAGSLGGNVVLQNSNSIVFTATANQSYGGVISGTGKLEKYGNGSTLTLSGTGSVISQGIDINNSSTLRNTGSATVGTTTIYNNGGVFNNEGTFTLSGNLQNASWIPNATFANSGTINQTGGNRMIFLNEAASFANTGTITVNRLSVGDWGNDGGAATTATFTNGAGGNMTITDMSVGGWKYGTYNNNGGNLTVASTLNIGKPSDSRTAAAGTNTF